MEEELASSPDQRRVDREHLNLLSVFHFVGAGLALLGVAFLLVHALMMSTIMKNPAMWAKSPSAAPPPELFDAFRWMYLVFGSWMATTLVFNLAAGFFLRARKHRTVCFVAGAVNCVQVPFGTILGIFTFIVLARASVRAAFQAGTHGGGRLE